MVPLLIFLLIGGNISADILSENYIERNGQTILQLMVSVDSGSMSPNLNIGDLVVVENTSKNNIIAWDEAEQTGYKSFNLPGDVILYRPYGKDYLTRQDQCQLLLGNSPSNEKATPIIHRALRYVNAGEPMWQDGPAAPFSGYITKGDHNEVIDQMAGGLRVADASYLDMHRSDLMDVGSSVYLDKKTGLLIYGTKNGSSFVGEGISLLVPVKEEWIIGIARTKISYGKDWTK
jgi:signal peptidase